MAAAASTAVLLAAATSEQEAAAPTRPPIPLTTIYTPPATCNSYVTWDGTTLWQNGISQVGDPDCYPPKFYSIYDSWYTPGICPHQWTSVGQNQHPSSYMEAMCCPSSYILSTTEASVLANFCFSLMTAPLSNVVFVSEIGDVAPQNPTLNTVHTTDVSSTTVYADVIQVHWQSKDSKIINLLKQSTAASLNGNSVGPTAAPGPTAVPGVGTLTTTPSSTATGTISATTSPSSGLSTGAKVGIGIAVPLAVIAIAAIAAALFVLRRRRRVPANTSGGKEGSGGYITAYQEMDHKEAERKRAPYEMDASHVGELPGSLYRAELEDRNRGQHSMVNTP